VRLVTVLALMAHSIGWRMPKIRSKPTYGAPRPPIKVGESWPLGRIAFSLLPLTGAERRKTVQASVVRGRIWTHDQLQGVINVNVPVRQTVIKLDGGGLWVHNPVAPTQECVAMMRVLEAEHGPVRHIVLGTLGLEHKAFAGPFSRAFPQATVWLQPGQWSFPLALPLPLLGFPTGSKLRTLPLGSSSDASEGSRRGASRAVADAVPWANEIGYEMLGPLKFKSVGAFGETAFLHHASGTLVLTDTILKVEEEPPPILQEDPRALLFHARDTISEEIRDSPEARRRGWRRISLFGLYFFPAAINVRLGSALSDLTRLPSTMNTLGEGAVPFNLYPWEWARDDSPAFNGLRSGRAGLLCAPILQALILNRFPEELKEWVERVSRLKFKRIIPCHFANNVRASPADFVSAFDFIHDNQNVGGSDDSQSSKELGSGAATSSTGRLSALRPRFWASTALPMDSENADFSFLLNASNVCTRVGITAAPLAGPLAGSN